MNRNNLTRQQLKDLESLFELVSDRQLKDFGNISASNKSDGSLITRKLKLIISKEVNAYLYAADLLKFYKKNLILCFLEKLDFLVYQV